MKRSMTQRSYLGWQRYWEEEPWGPWRDNIHAAIVAREVRRLFVKPGTRIKLDPFLVRSPRSRRKEGEEGLLNTMMTVATPVSPAEAERRRATRKSKRKRARK